MVREDSIKDTAKELFTRYEALRQCESDIWAAYELLVKCFENGGKLLICGSGGSASDALHITGELMKSFITKRGIDASVAEELKKRFPEDAEYLVGSLQGALPTVALVENSALATAVQNDIAGDLVTAQQVIGLGKSGDVLLAISTSGNSRSGSLAVEVAAAKGMGTIGLTGADGGKYKMLCDCTIRVPEKETFKVQELHLPVYHALCRMLEIHFFGE